MARRMRFSTWCAKDPDDTTKIVYTFRMKEWNGYEHTEYFTSEDEVSILTLSRFRRAWVENIERIQNEFSDHWNVVLYED